MRDGKVKEWREGFMVEILGITKKKKKKEKESALQHLNNKKKKRETGEGLGVKADV